MCGSSRRETAMTMLIRFVASAMISTLLATGAFAEESANPDAIEHHVASVNGVRFHYVTAGTGEAVLLLPGWPESWIAWRKVVPLLVASGRRAVVLDPRGFGESEKTASGYDL